MYRLLLTALAVVLLGCGTAEAQMTSPNPSRTLPVRRPSPSPTLMTAPSLMPVPGTLTAGSVTPGGLGTVQLYLGILAPFPGTSLGGIATCPAAGIMGPTSTGAASGATVSGGLVSSPSASAGASNFSISSPPIVPPIPITDPFGTITASTFCNPTATMTDPASLASTVDPTLTSTTDPTLTSALFGDAAGVHHRHTGQGSMHYLPLSLPFFSILVGLFLLLVALIQVGILRYAYMRLGVGSGTPLLLLLGSLLGS